MTAFRLMLLASTALTLNGTVALHARADTQMMLAQLAAPEPGEGRGGPDGRPKGPPRPEGAQPRPGGPGGGPPAGVPRPEVAPPRPVAPPPVAPRQEAPPPPPRQEAPRPAPPPVVQPAPPRPEVAPPPLEQRAPRPEAAPPRPVPPPAAPVRPEPPAARPPAAEQAPPRPTPPAPPVPPAARPAAPPPATPPAAAPPAPVPPAAGGAREQTLPAPAPGQRPGAAPRVDGGPPQRPVPPPPPNAAAPAPQPVPPATAPLTAAPVAPPPAPGAVPPAAVQRDQIAPGPGGRAPGARQDGAAPAAVGPQGAQLPPPAAAPLPAPPPAQAAAPLVSPGGVTPGARSLEDFRGERRQVQEGGRTVTTEPGRIIIQDPSGRSFVRSNEVDRFRYGARDVQVVRDGRDTRTIVVRPDGSQIITVTGGDGQLLRRIRRDDRGREVIIIDNSYRDPGAVGGFYVDLPPPIIRIPRDRYIVESEDAPPELIYDTMIAPPVERIPRRFSLDEIRYSPSVRQLMPSIDLDTINFETGSWEIPPDQAAKLQSIADGLNRAIERNPREVFLIEGHTDAVGSDVDNLSLSDRRAQSAAELLTRQFRVPEENLTSQGYGKQYLKIPTDGPERRNRRVTVRRITPLLNGGQASLPPPPPGTAPPR